MAKVDLNEVMKFMEAFGIEALTKRGELIFDYKTNTFAYIADCDDMEDVEMRVVFALCRPIAKGLDKPDANKLLEKVNDYFNSDLTREDMHLMYSELCYRDKFEDFKSFIKKGFPMHELKNTLL